MTDQAAQLRHLVLRAHRQRDTESLHTPFTIAVVGGARGVGTTTVAVDLATALVEHGSRVVAADIDSHQPSFLEACGLEIPVDYQPWQARRDLHAALVRGPLGIQLVPGVWARYPAENEQEIGWPQLAKQFQQLGKHTDILLLDCGNPTVSFLRNVGNFSDIVLFVTSPLANIVTRTYTLLKGCVSGGVRPAVHLLLNQVRNAQEAIGVAHRFERSCRRFLEMPVLSSSYWLQDALAAERREQLEELVIQCHAGVVEKLELPKLVGVK